MSAFTEVQTSPQLPLRLATLVLVPLLLTALGLALWAWEADREGRALRALPEPERKELYQRTLETLQTVCRGPEGARLTDTCRQQAELVLRFDECDRACQALAREHLRSPTR